MVYRGTIKDIIKVSDTVTQVILTVKIKTGYTVVCFIAYGNQKVLINQLNLEKKDIVKIDYHLSSKKFETKYYTSAVVENIKLVQKRPTQYFVDEATGELF